MMTRKHFKQIAETMRFYCTHASLEERTLVRKISTDIANICKKDNPTFDRSKFMRACGFYDE